MPKKISQFEAERQNILVELLQILEINENNNKFFLDELDNNIIKQNSIIGLVDSVKKYFNCGKWSCFVNINVNSLIAASYEIKDEIFKSTFRN